ncbi:MAG: MauE/DoxX family redox-associated membrane protein [Clostridium butyricum]|uniref:MauE/DoxX family redox-associated membrane protein n=1 Tax=Clostridium sp. TaxID=1506 RepID=UPI00290298CF|nr:MauE/DoxX family redox-associated membrane protein [Clostridium sp.]MDU1117059.1 MauE/DoxX family redox-associated membrane protein [Clostridium sp.]MDU7713383.1 MauE/DoxX family redox-associated membrane protein [Clostridium butyricum]
MDILGCIFFSTITITLIFAGISKMISYKNTIDTIKKIDIFPKRISNVVGIFMPLFEVIMALLLIIKSNKLIIVILILGYLLFFIGLNLKYTMEKKEIKCCCYGKIIQSKLGKGGLIHYLYLLVLLVIGYKCVNKSIINIINLYKIDSYRILVIIVVSFLLMINGFLIRSMIEKYGLKEW